MDNLEDNNLLKNENITGGLYGDSSRDTEKELTLLNKNENNNLEGDILMDKRRFNQSINYNINQVHEKISRDLAEGEELDENNDADPEDLVQKSPDDLNKTMGDIFALQMFGKKDPNEKIVPFDSRRATLFERMLHPMNYGSLRGSIFGLSSMCLDSGSLILANRCKDFGVINFALSLILGGIVAYWSLVMMIKAARNLKERDYSKVVKKILGEKAGTFLDIIIALFFFGLLISFQVIIYSLIGRVIYDIFIDQEKYKAFDEYNEKVWDKMIIKFPIMFGVIALAFPLCLLKDVSKMRIPSLLGVLALVYSIIVVVVQSPFYLKDFLYKKKKTLGEMNWIDIRKAFSKETNYSFFAGIANVIYIYSCHAGAFPVYKTLYNNTTRRIKKVFRRSILLDFILYFSVAIASFLTTPLEPDDLILYRKSIFEHDYFMIAAKIGVIFNLFFCTPVNYAALRISVFELIWGNTNFDNAKNVLVSTIILAILTLIGALYSDILSYISLLGGFCSVIYCFLIPGLIYVKNRKEPMFNLSGIFVLFVVVLITLIGYTSGVLTIIFDMILKK